MANEKKKHRELMLKGWTPRNHGGIGGWMAPTGAVLKIGTAEAWDMQFGPVLGAEAAPSDDAMAGELTCAGWSEKVDRIWASPEGKLHGGLRHAWKEMRRAQVKSDG